MGPVVSSCEDDRVPIWTEIKTGNRSHAPDIALGVLLLKIPEINVPIGPASQHKTLSSRVEQGFIYLMYLFLLVGDILALRDKKKGNWALLIRGDGLGKLILDSLLVIVRPRLRGLFLVVPNNRLAATGDNSPDLLLGFDAAVREVALQVIAEVLYLVRGQVPNGVDVQDCELQIAEDHYQVIEVRLQIDYEVLKGDLLLGLIEVLSWEYIEGLRGRY